MIKDITLGQYFPGNSLIHRLDPRMKIILLLLYMVVLFMASGWVAYLLLTAVTVFLMLLSRIPVKLYLRGLRPLLIIICFTALLNIFYTSGEVLVQFWVFKITKEGLFNAAYMILRILMLVIATSMLTYTTSPIVLTGGLESLLSPLRVLRIPVHEFSMMMTMALRFIPTLLEETDKIISAQKARGADFESGNLIRRVKALTPVLIPLFVSAFRRAEELATAMECRGYTGEGKNRSRFVQYRLCLRDYASLLFVVGLGAAVFFTDFLPF